MSTFNFPAIILASKSPRRAELLRQIGVSFEVILPQNEHVAEALESILPHEKPLDYVQRVSRLKAQMMQAEVLKYSPERLHKHPILCADTTVALDEQIFGKPEDAAHAFAMLRQLSGKKHQVHTAIALVHGNEVHQRVVSSSVCFKSMSDADIEAYINSQEPFGKAGAYAIQGIGACFIEHLSGSFSAVKGLPLFELAQLLRSIQTQVPA